MSRKIVAGNWKMNKNFDEALALAKDLNDRAGEFPKDVKVIIAPPSLYISAVSDNSGDSIHVAAQNCNENSSGAFTGEISATMLQSMNIPYCILGHSERRSIYRESNEKIGEKVKAALAANLKAIFCCGEMLEERESDSHFDIIKTQIETGVFDLSVDEFEEVIIAYEPVWAIGTGVTASSEQAQEMHAFIRKLIADKYGNDIAENTSILYGGSCKPSNAVELFSCADIDGGLIGGAALNADDFIAIIKANA